ncbi:hypothetical protein V5799_011531, partial [Amblyomma americanum]
MKKLDSLLRRRRLSGASPQAGALSRTRKAKGNLIKQEMLEKQRRFLLQSRLDAKRLEVEARISPNQEAQGKEFGASAVATRSRCPWASRLRPPVAAADTLLAAGPRLEECGLFWRCGEGPQAGGVETRREWMRRPQPRNSSTLNLGVRFCQNIVSKDCARAGKDRAHTVALGEHFDAVGHPVPICNNLFCRQINGISFLKYCNALFESAM